MSLIKFLDIYNQDRTIHKQIIEKISATIKKNKFILTKEVEEFEKNFSRFCGTNFTVGVANGTDALYLALKALNLKKNDEVILPAMTWKSTILSVINSGLKPVLVDIKKDSSNFDLNQLKKKINNKTKAIIVVHLYGNPGEIFKIKKLIKSKNIKIIEDAAQAHGAVENQTKKIVGSIGDIACFSFYPGKNLGAYGDAGCITTNKKKYYKEVLKLRNLGTYDKNNKSDCIVSGINSRLDTIQSIILNIKLNHLKKLNNKRIKIANYYNKNITNLKVEKLIYNYGSVYHQYVIKVKNRIKFLKFLTKNKIEYGIHYQTSINKLKFVTKLYKKQKFPNAEKLSKSCVSIPIDPFLRNIEIVKIVKIINSF
jgi:dTDP-4-amino-4,6-dideoxygalactose transaminase